MWDLIEEMFEREGRRYVDGWLIEMYIRIANTYGLCVALEILQGYDHWYTYW